MRILTDAFNRDRQIAHQEKSEEHKQHRLLIARRHLRNETRHFAQANQQKDGLWHVNESEKYSVSYHHRPMGKNLTLEQALQKLHNWQEKHLASKNFRLAHEALYEEGMHYKAVAQQQGVDLGNNPPKPSVPKQKKPAPLPRVLRRD